MCYIIIECTYIYKYVHGSVCCGLGVPWYPKVFRYCKVFEVPNTYDVQNFMFGACCNFYSYLRVEGLWTRWVPELHVWTSSSSKSSKVYKVYKTREIQKSVVGQGVCLYISGYIQILTYCTSCWSATNPYAAFTPLRTLSHLTAKPQYDPPLHANLHVHNLCLIHATNLPQTSNNPCTCHAIPCLMHA